MEMGNQWVGRGSPADWMQHVDLVLCSLMFPTSELWMSTWSSLTSLSSKPVITTNMSPLFFEGSWLACLPTIPVLSFSCSAASGSFYQVQFWHSYHTPCFYSFLVGNKIIMTTHYLDDVAMERYQPFPKYRYKLLPHGCLAAVPCIYFGKLIWYP